MTTQYEGEPEWSDEVPIVADGDSANAATMAAVLQPLSDRLRFLIESLPVALANYELVDSDSSHTLDGLFDICFGWGAGDDDGGLFLAVGVSNANQALRWNSRDGTTWTKTAIATIDGGAAAGVWYGCAHGGPGAFGSRKFVFVGEDGFNLPVIRYCADSSTPTIYASGVPAGFSAVTAGLRSVAWGEASGVWCAVGKRGGGVTPICTTPDATASFWTQRSPANSYAGDFNKVIASSSGDRFLACGTLGVIQTSDGGTTWTERYNNATVGNIVSISRASSQSGFEFIAATESGYILRSTDAGNTWSTVTLPTAQLGVLGIGAPVFELVTCMGEVCLALLHDGASANLRAKMISFDRGATWSVVARAPEGSAVYRAAANDFCRAAIVATDAAFASAGVFVTPWQSTRIG